MYTDHNKGVVFSLILRGGRRKHLRRHGQFYYGRKQHLLAVKTIQKFKKNQLRSARVTVKYRLSRFSGSQRILLSLLLLCTNMIKASLLRVYARNAQTTPTS